MHRRRRRIEDQRARSVDADDATLHLAEERGISLREYQIIYNLVDDVKAALLPACFRHGTRTRCALVVGRSLAMRPQVATRAPGAMRVPQIAVPGPRRSRVVSRAARASTT